MGIVLSMTSYIPARMAIARYQAPQPEGILVLGGARAREFRAARLSRSYPDMDVWVSSGSLPHDSKRIFRHMRADTGQLQWDFQATDTVSNFTTMLPRLKAANIRHIYLVTSDFHMNRAKAIATIVLGSHGITYTPVVVPSSRENESLGHVIRDVTRSMVWLATGKTGSRLKHPDCYGINEFEVVIELVKLKSVHCQRITQQ